MLKPCYMFDWPGRGSMIGLTVLVGLASSGVATAAEAERQNAPAGTIQVRVVGPDGSPMAGVRVHASIWANVPAKGNRDYVTDAKGETTVELSQGIKILRLWASADGYVPLFAHWEQAELQTNPQAIPRDFTFHLQKGTVVGGLVKDVDGHPIAGAKVEVMLRSDPRKEQKRVLVSIWLAEGDEAPVTDADGRWTLDDVPPGDDVGVLVRLSHPDYINDYRWGVMQQAAGVTTASLREQTGTIVMARGVRVTGTVTDPAGKPVAGAVVVWGDDPYGLDGSQEVRTNEKGGYRFAPLPPMPIRVTVIAEGWAPAMKETTITPENPSVDFQLEPGRTLRLRFVDESGKAVPGVYVGIDGWQGAKSLYNHKHPNVLDTKIPRQADESGVYEWTWAPSTEVRYDFGKEGYGGRRGAPFTADGSEHKVILTR